MAKTKLEVKDFLEQILNEAGCKGIHHIGENINCQCPFHWPIKNVSAFGISYSKEGEGYPYRCYSCHEVGNIYTLIMHLNKCSYSEAKKLFRKKVSLLPITIQSLKQSYRKLRQNKSVMNENVLEDFPERFNNGPMLEYLNDRNQYQQHNVMNVPYIVSKYDLYYCDSGRYAKRIIMPIRNLDGEYIFFTNRAIYEGYKKNIFPKGFDATKYMYGIYESLGRTKVILVEGPFEVYQLVSYCIKNNIKDYAIVACMGTELTELRASILSELFKTCYIVFDNDLPDRYGNRAGPDGEEKAYKILSDFMETYRCTRLIHPGKDPAICSESQLSKIFSFKPKRRLLVSLRN